MLDLWQNDQARAAAPQPGEATQMPAGFGEAFGAAFEEGRLFSQSLAHENASMEALGDYLTEIKQKTGQDIPLDYGSGEQVPSSALLWMQANDAVAQLKAKNPALDIAPLSQDEMEQRAVAKSRGAVEAAAQVGGREMTTGGRVGFELGGLAAAATDPINIAAVLLAPESSLGILGSALRFGGIAAGAQAGIEAVGAPFREEVQPGYLQSGAPIENIAGAAVGGAVLGGGFKAAGNLWTRLKTGTWPTAIRDAGNVVESEANIQGSNVYPGAAGEAAHRQALASAIDSILGDKPVDVGDIITPDIEAQSRDLMMRLQGARAFSLPIFDERSIRLTSEEAQLREQDAALAGQLAGLPEGDASAADRLNRLQTVEQQLAAAPDEATRRALNQRRDQILVDTNPETLQLAAAPIAQRQALGAQRGQIAQRLGEIMGERGQIEADNLGRATPAALGQTMPAGGPEIERIVSEASARAMQRPIVETPMPSGANSSRDPNGPVYVDPRVPAAYRRPVAVHETVEQELQARGFSYLHAHQIATQAEKRAVEAAGLDWGEYTHSWDGLLAKIEHEKVSNLPPDLHVDPEAAIGHHSSASKQVRGVPVMQARALAARLAEEAKTAGRETAAVPQPELPFEANAAVERMRSANEVLAGGVQQIARRAGYEMPDAEAATIADKLVKATPAEADDLLRDLQMSPRQVAEAPIAGREPAMEGPTSVEPAERVVASPDYEKAIRADLDRERMIGDRQIPVGVDADGNVTMRSVDAALNEVDAYKIAAEQMASCAAPEPEPAEAEAA